MTSICHFLFFMSCPDLPMYMSGVFSFPVQSGGSLTKGSIFSGVGKLALNSDII